MTLYSETVRQVPPDLRLVPLAQVSELAWQLVVRHAPVPAPNSADLHGPVGRHDPDVLHDQVVLRWQLHCW
ncbi:MULTISPECIES: hypothetical protein [Micrococcaceae]|uniref:hypothetical protein n=1 Tax=Micrococcaceae TaxID=1268 RepID=UPI0010368624|nr:MULTISPECIES: hypothetical protein [Micrococcaceae]TAP28447.1 hypothetical protein EYR88_09140 [Arthrobacter sp. S41]UXN32766.1 hypothetical protein N6V40_04765 [Glutamicibacter sp. M10]